MRSICVAIMAAGTFGAAASAQTVTRWLFEFSNPVLSPSNPSTTVTLVAEFPRSDYAFAEALLDAHASEPGWSDPFVIPLVAPHPLPGNPGEISGGDVRGISNSQLHIGPFVANPTNPIPIWGATFTATDFAPREISLSTTTEQFFVYIDRETSASEPRAVIEGAAIIRVIPAPAGLALLAFGGLAGACRRRRRTSAARAVAGDRSVVEPV